MITDDQLYNLAVFLGIAAMVLIVVYHFLEVNAVDAPAAPAKAGAPPPAASKASR